MWMIDSNGESWFIFEYVEDEEVAAGLCPWVIVGDEQPSEARARYVAEHVFGFDPSEEAR